MTTTTTPADVLARLQAAWLTPSLPAVDSADANHEAEAEPATVAYCGPHNDPTQWEYSPDKYKRDGWRTAHCKRCGRFVGYQRPQQQRKRKRRQPDAGQGSK